MIYYETDYLMHHGVKGMKWGVRRYQNKDGTLTALGRKHFGIGDEKNTRLKNLEVLNQNRVSGKAWKNVFARKVYPRKMRKKELMIAFVLEKR